MMLKIEHNVSNNLGVHIEDKVKQLLIKNHKKYDSQ